MTLLEAFDDSLARERELVVDLPLPDGGKVRQLANPIEFSETKPIYKSVGVSVATGTHTREVLKELGYEDGEIEEFEKTGLFS